MRIAVVFRGYHYVPARNKDKPWLADFVDCRECVPNIQAMVLNPLKEEGHDVDVFVATYDSPFTNTLYDSLGPKKVFVIPEDTQIHHQKWMVEQAIHLIPVETYDRIVVLRFDIKYKIPIHKWQSVSWTAVPPLQPCVYVPWYEHCNVERHCDVVFIIDGYDGLCHFKDALQKFTYGHDLHGLGNLLKPVTTFQIMYNGFYDSATFWNNAASKNPLFVMHGRKYFHEDAPF